MAVPADTAHFVNEYTFSRLSEFVFKIVQVRSTGSGGNTTILLLLCLKTFTAPQADHCGEFPFFYAILGTDKVILIDTGVGPPSGGLGGASAAQIASRSERSLKAILDEQINPTGLPYKILATHVHYDHIGNVHAFADAEGHVDVAMGDSDPDYATAISSHACGAARGAAVKPFTVKQWLSPGEEVFLDDAQQCDWNAVRAIPCPGHTPDSTAYYFPRERRLFVADTVYPFTAISLLCTGSSLAEYSGSIHTLLQLVQQEEEGGLPDMPGGVHAVMTAPAEPSDAPAAVTAHTSGLPPSDAVVPSLAHASSAGADAEGAEANIAETSESETTADTVAPATAADQAAAALAELEPHEAAAVSELCGVWLGVEGGLAGVWAELKFDPVALLRVNDWSVEGAMGMWGELGAVGLRSMLPSPARQGGRVAAAVAAAGLAPDNIVSCALALPVPAVPVGMAPDTPAQADEAAPVAQVTLACGHVEAALPAKGALTSIFRLLVAIAAGDAKPTKVMRTAKAAQQQPPSTAGAGGGEDEGAPLWSQPQGAAEYATEDGQFVLHLPFPAVF